MTRLIYTLFALLVIAAPLSAFAAFRMGQVLKHPHMAVCLDKKDAVAIINTHAKEGLEAATVLWASLDRCQNVHVDGPTVGKVVHSVKIGEKTARVVEIVSEGQVLGYFFTTEDVQVAQNNS